MKRKCKLFLVCFLMAAAVLLEPVSYVLADETTSGETNERTIFPHVLGSEVEFVKKDFFDWFGLADIPKENVIQKIVVTHSSNEYIDYSLYDLVCDFELKTLNNDGSITTSLYSHVIDLDNFMFKTLFEDATSLDVFRILNNHYDVCTKEFIHEFDYEKIVENADGFIKKNVSGKKIYYTYNTVISQLDLYFVCKSDGEVGRVRRFKFTWDSDFWLQKCTKIEFLWYAAEEDYEKPIDSVENIDGVDGFSTDNDEEFIWKDILTFFKDLPSSLIALIVGFIEIVGYIAKLFSTVFPFIPPVIFYFFAGFILLTILIAIYKLVLSAL